jgi:putative endonuclease
VTARETAPPRPAKIAAQRFGRRAEWLAAALLRLKGYRILARDFRVPVGEIDVIARRGRTLAFVEVKARRGDGAAEALSGRQRRRIARAAEWYLRRCPDLGDLTVRFDVILIGRGRWPQHRQGAWRIDD